MNGHTSNNILRAALKAMYQNSKFRANDCDVKGDATGEEYYQGRADAAAELAIDLGIVNTRDELAD